MKYKIKTFIKDLPYLLSRLFVNVKFPDLGFYAQNLAYGTGANYTQQTLTLRSNVAPTFDIEIQSRVYTDSTLSYVKVGFTSAEFPAYFYFSKDMYEAEIEILNEVVEAKPVFTFLVHYIAGTGFLTPGHKTRLVSFQRCVPILTGINTEVMVSTLFTDNNVAIEGCEVRGFTSPVLILPAVTGNANESVITDDKVATYLAFLYSDDVTAPSGETLLGYLDPRYSTLILDSDLSVPIDSQHRRLDSNLLAFTCEKVVLPFSDIVTSTSTDVRLCTIIGT